MEQPNWESMTNSQLIDYHMERNRESEALSIYVRRIHGDSQTVWINPEDNIRELEKLMQSLESKK